MIFRCSENHKCTNGTVFPAVTVELRILSKSTDNKWPLMSGPKPSLTRREILVGNALAVLF